MPLVDVIEYHCILIAMFGAKCPGNDERVPTPSLAKCRAGGDIPRIGLDKPTLLLACYIFEIKCFAMSLRHLYIRLSFVRILDLVSDSFYTRSNFIKDE